MPTTITREAVGKTFHVAAVLTDGVMTSAYLNGKKVPVDHPAVAFIAGPNWTATDQAQSSAEYDYPLDESRIREHGEAAMGLTDPD